MAVHTHLVTRTAVRLRIRRQLIKRHMYSRSACADAASYGSAAASASLSSKHPVAFGHGIAHRAKFSYTRYVIAGS